MTSQMTFTLGDLNEAIAGAYPDREAMVTASRRLSWRDLQLRTRRLAHLLHGAGLGCRRERGGLQPWESGQDHLGLYLYNCNEYLEGMIGASKARLASFNINYRYVDDELLYLLQDAGPRALLYHAGFAPHLARLLPRLAHVDLLLQVDDGSGEPLLPGALDYEEALAGSSEEPLPVRPQDDDLYIIYTGGTTGMPKGVLWRQVDIFFSAMGGRILGGEAVASVEDQVERAKGGDMLRTLPAPPFMHGAAHWSSFIILHQGGTVVLPRNTHRFDPDDVWSTIEREKVVTLTIVGDAFARPLLEQLRKKTYDLSSLRILGSGGAMLSPDLKREFLAHLPDIVIFDGFGASETGAQGSTVMMKGMDAPPPNFQMDDHTVVLDAELKRKLAPGEKQMGWLARTGHVPLGYLSDEEKTSRTYPTIEGVRYAVPGDRAQVDADGTIQIFGRDSVCINTGGEKVFAEEVELAIKRHPAVYDVIVIGTPHERWGQQVTAVIALQSGVEATEDELRDAAAAHLARYKLPRTFVFVETVTRSPTGKPDYRWARETALRLLAG